MHLILGWPAPIRFLNYKSTKNEWGSSAIVHLNLLYETFSSGCLPFFSFSYLITSKSFPAWVKLLIKPTRGWVSAVHTIRDVRGYLTHHSLLQINSGKVGLGFYSCCTHWFSAGKCAGCCVPRLQNCTELITSYLAVINDYVWSTSVLFI